MRVNYKLSRGCGKVSVSVQLQITRIVLTEKAWSKVVEEVKETGNTIYYRFILFIVT